MWLNKSSAPLARPATWARSAQRTKPVVFPLSIKKGMSSSEWEEMPIFACLESNRGKAIDG
jgi:hypothetical protein